MYTVRYRAGAAKMLQRMPRNIAKTVVRKIDQLAESPYAPNKNVTRLKGERGYRLRVGDCRVLYEIRDNNLVIEIIKIGPRGGVYQ
ncbi:MAG: type II toxin-antitoxin system RelE/ParE family toxin [Candidatus Poribacteria bacterium]|nr:type II toxin-antitoxin system RelE/ParE family toxin [Candidatus Poribacteria bacterium]